MEGPAMTESMKRCGNCVYCRHRPITGGVQVVTGERVHVCFAMPPAAYPLPNGKILTIRPPVDEDAPACSKWRAMQ